MKRLVILLIVFFASYVYADMTCTGTIDQSVSWSGGRGDTYQSSKRLRIDCEMDADSDPAEVVLSAILSTEILGQLKGGILYSIVTQPGTDAPGSVYTVTIDGSEGQDWGSITTTSTSLAEDWDMSTVNGFRPIFWDMQIDYPDIGDTGDDVIMFLNILK